MTFHYKQIVASRHFINIDAFVHPFLIVASTNLIICSRTLSLWGGFSVGVPDIAIC